MSTYNNTQSEDKKVRVVSTLKNKNQWICWNIEEKDGRETKVPIDPHGSGYADTTDPETWTSYEDAVEYKEQADCDGIGFVFTQEGWIVGVDLDDCRDPDSGQLESWADDVVDTLDSYTEISPSGEGLHIYVEGTLRGLENNRKDELENVDGDGHLEMYEESRFFTFSEIHLEGTKKTVENRQNQIEEVGEKYLEDDEKYAQKDFDPDNIDLDLSDEEIIEKAKSAENGDEFERLWRGDISGYDDDHSRADLALLNKLAFWTACDDSRMEQLFSQSGLSREKWENREDYRERSISKAVRSCTEVYDPDDSDSEKTTEQKGADVIPRDVDLVVHNGCYATKKRVDEDEYKYKHITSFVLEKEQVLYTNNGDQRLKLEVIPRKKPNYTVTVYSTVFNEARDFKEEVCKREGVTFQGSTRQLADIELIVANQDAPEKTSVDTVGYDSDREKIITPQGVIDENGVVENPDEIYNPADDIDIEGKWNVDFTEDVDYDKEEVAQILELAWKTRTKQEILPTLGYWYSSLFTPQIREYEGEMGLLHIRGGTESGKSSILELLMEMFGLSKEPYDADSTPASHRTTLSSTNNIPIWMDEYKPSDIHKRRLNALHDFIRNATKKQKKTVSSSSHDQKAWTIQSPIVLSGEENFPASRNAERRRAIQIQFLNSTKENLEYKKPYKKLVGGDYKPDDQVQYERGYDISQHAKALYPFVCQIEDFEEYWREAKDKVYEILEKHQIEGISAGTDITNLTSIKFGLSIYRFLAYEVGADADEMFINEDVEEAIVEVAKTMGHNNRTSHLDEFIKLVAHAINDDYLTTDGEYENKADYTIVRMDKPNEHLRFKLDKAYSAVSKYVKDHDLTVDLLSTPGDYRDRMKDNSEYVHTTGIPTGDMGRTISIRTHDAEEEIDGFERGLLNPELYD